ncbi:MAG: hypothetical protein QM747_17945 [Nocardioides sp.]
MTNGNTTTVCPTCGCTVVDELRHTEFHHRIEAIERDTDHALELAQAAAKRD